MRLRYGDIALVAALPDPRGQNPKDRPVVIVTPTDEMENAGSIFVVAITTTLQDPLPEDYVPLAWQRPRHPRTGLNARNAAVAHWLMQIEPKRLIRVIGKTSIQELEKIGEALRRLANEV